MIGTAIREALKQAYADHGIGLRVLADRAGITHDVARGLINDRAKHVDIDAAVRLGEQLGVDVAALIASMSSRAGGTATDDFVAIPRYDARLSAGYGVLNFDQAPILDHIPFTREFLRERLGRASARGLVMVKAQGDSMEPTIGDGDLVMVDTEDRDLSGGGIFAVVWQGDTLVKRVEKLGDAVVLSSEKPGYAPVRISGDELADFRVIGRVRWVGRVLG
jgi:phage repressor protein C with HTH and peptisase S24 domain